MQLRVKGETEVLEDILFCSSVLMFAMAAILAYWQILLTANEGAIQPQPPSVPVQQEAVQPVLADLAA